MPIDAERFRPLLDTDAPLGQLTQQIKFALMMEGQLDFQPIARAMGQFADDERQRSVRREFGSPGRIRTSDQPVNS
jgi:hypothetical protein